MSLESTTCTALRSGAAGAGLGLLLLTLVACARDGGAGMRGSSPDVRDPAGGAGDPGAAGQDPTGAGMTDSALPSNGGTDASGAPVSESPGSAGDGDAPGGAGSPASEDPPAMAGDFVNLAPPMGEPFDPANATTVMPAPPPGWTWYEVPGTFCRDGSPNGLYIRHTSSDKLVIYFEGGGACTSKGFCHFNPQSVNHVLTGDGQTVIGTVFAVGPGRQQPGVYNLGVLGGIFDDANTQNPFQGWNMVYIPYCTGDVHFGSNENGTILNVPEKQKFVGYKNNRIFMGRLAATFKGEVERVVVTGASAGSFGAALNFSLISDTFAGTQVDAVLDSGAPFEDAHWPACMQQAWRKTWGLNDSLPPDCEECFQADGGGMIGLGDFLIRKHPTGNLAAISSLHDEVIRLFFAPGQNNCATMETADPFEITTSQLLGGTIFPAAEYEAGLMGVRAKYASTGRLATYMFGAPIDTLHQHTFRARFYEPVVAGKSMAQFVGDFLAGTMTDVGP